MFILNGCDDTSNAKIKPFNVPDSAIWAGGVDGGAWFACELTQGFDKYYCSVFNDFNGAVTAKGKYLLLKSRTLEDKNKIVFEPIESSKNISISFFDGQKIHLKGNFILVPDGIIDYPFDGTSGKKQLFKKGIPVGEEIEYGSDPVSQFEQINKDIYGRPKN